jgi:hypothetical protein
MRRDVLRPQEFHRQYAALAASLGRVGTRDRAVNS